MARIVEAVRARRSPPRRSAVEGGHSQACSIQEDGDGGFSVGLEILGIFYVAFHSVSVLVQVYIRYTMRIAIQFITNNPDSSVSA